MNLLGVFKRSFKFILDRLLELSFITTLILFIPNLPPYTTFSKSIILPKTKELKGTLALNDKLNNVEILYKSRLVGPEAFSAYDKELYTGLNGGDIVKLIGNHIVPVVKTGKPCKDQYEEKICGRPLGVQFGKNGYLYVADAYYGILKIQVEDGIKTVLVSPNTVISGKKTKWFNGITVAKNGDIFWTASSTEFSLEDGLFEILSDPTGRLVHYNSSTKKNTVLIDNLGTANGVALSDNEEFVLVSESITSRILRYYLKGPKTGTYDTFIDGLPGLPDNINSDKHGGFLVPLVSPVDPCCADFRGFLLKFPWARKLIARILRIIQLSIEATDRIVPTKFNKIAIYSIGRIAPLASLLDSSRTSIIHVSKNGEILDSIHATNRKIRGVSDAYIFKNYLYLGSAQEDYIGRIPLDKVGWGHLA